MAQVYEFQVVGIEVGTDKGEVRLHGKFHPAYTSQVFLKVPAEELSKFQIGQIYSLTAQEQAEVVETVPLGGKCTRWLAGDADIFSDGSPVPAEEGEV